MNEVDPLILYTDVSTKAIGGGGGGGGSCKSKNGIEKPVIFISHALSDQATRWGIMELELYAFVYCLKNLTPYLLGKQFTVGTDHRNLLYLSNSSVPKFVRWRVLLSEFQFLVEHISEDQNVVADGLTRVSRTTLMEMPTHKCHLFMDDSIQRIFRLREEVLEETVVPGEF